MSGLVPKLRFKQDDGSNFPEWGLKKLSHLSKPITRTIDHQGTTPVLTISAGAGFLNQTDRFNRVIAGTSLKKYTLLRKNEFAYNKGASKRYPYGCIYQLKAHSQALIPFVYHSFKLNGECEDYYSFYFEKGSLDKQLRRIISSSARLDGLLNIGAKDFYSILVSVPSLPEQQKIADFLSSVDAKIDAVKRKLDALERYKKGLMQQIFSRKLRFKQDDGSDFPEWEEKRLGSLCSIKTGKLDANAMVSNGAFPFFTCAREVYRIDEFAFDTDALLISGNGANVGYIHQYNGKFNAYQRTYILSDFIDIYKIFLFYFLEKQLKARIYTEAKEGNTPYIVMGTLTDMCIDIPSLPEQQKIADFLSSVDAKIGAIKAKIEKLEAFKKGLLQQMFV